MNPVLFLALSVAPLAGDPARAADAFAQDRRATQVPPAEANTTVDPRAAAGVPWTRANLKVRIDDLSGQLESTSGREFKRPVRLVLVEPSDLARRIRLHLDEVFRPADGGAEERVAKLLGLLDGDDDLATLIDGVARDSSGSYYDVDTDTLYVDRSSTDRRDHLSLAQQLARALDDQYFDLGRLEDTGTDNRDMSLARRAVMTGATEELFEGWAREHLEGWNVYEQVLCTELMTSNGYEEAPPYMWRAASVMIQGGRAFLHRSSSLAARDRGVPRDDYERALYAPPNSTEQLLHPVKYWRPERREEPRIVTLDTKAIPPGWRAVHEDTLGELLLALVTLPEDDRGDRSSAALVERLNPRSTTAAAEGWGGDRYVLLESDGAELVHLVTRWDTVEDAAEFAEAMLRLRPLIQTSIERMPAYDGQPLELRVKWDGRDGVEVTSAIGVSAQVVEEIACSVGTSE